MMHGIMQDALFRNSHKQKASLTAGFPINDVMSALPVKPVSTEIWPTKDGNARPVRRPKIAVPANQRVRIDDLLCLMTKLSFSSTKAA